MATDNQVDAELLARLKPGATFINAGRGNCLVEQALLDAMDKKQISHAVLDVFREEPLPAAHPFWSIANVHITSHTSAPTRDSEIIKIFFANSMFDVLESNLKQLFSCLRFIWKEQTTF